MKINLVGLEDGFTSYGFRKIAAFIERLNPETRTHYISTDSGRNSPLKSITRKQGSLEDFTDDDVDLMAQQLCEADIVAFSCMTGYAPLAKRIIARIRELKPEVFMIWGGIHPIIYPEDAIESGVDAICTGEGEFAFEEFFDLFQKGEDFSRTRNFWFKTDEGVRKNPFRPLMTAEQMESLPFAKYGAGEFIFKRHHGFIPVTKNDYIRLNGLHYTTVWSIGCPLHCTFCGNTKFIANDKLYGRIRHSSPAYVVEEIKRVLEIHPHIQSVSFHDDSFLAIKTSEIEEFSAIWKRDLNLSFAIFGIIPNYVREDKLRLLTWAGMYRARMGIQSGSERILEFYRRPTPLDRVVAGANVLTKFKKNHVNPSYDIIVDNPVEERQDVIDTLELLYNLDRPYQLNIFSLRIIPNTQLEQQMIDHGLDVDAISENFNELKPTWANFMLYVLILWKPPRWLFDRMLKHVRATLEPQKLHPMKIIMIRIPWAIGQGIRHARVGDLSILGGSFAFLAYGIWKSGLLSLWKKLVAPRALKLENEPQLGTQGSGDSAT